MKITEKIIRAFLPEKCPLCGKLIDLREHSCPDCRSDIIKLGRDACQGCGYDTDRCICGQTEISFSHFAAVYLYTGLVKAEIHQFKFRGNKASGKKLGDEMAFRLSESFLDADFDCVTYVPMSRKSIKERGYNQSELLAKRVALRLFLPCESLLEKKSETEKQHQLDAAHRKLNIRGAFSFKENCTVKGKTVLLCDDVKTTGATLKECEKVLLQNGAKAVYCLTLALSDYGDIFSPLDKK